MNDEINVTKEYAFTEYRPEEVSVGLTVSPEAWAELCKIVPLTRWENIRWQAKEWMYWHRPHFHFGPCGD